MGKYIKMPMTPDDYAHFLRKAEMKEANIMREIQLLFTQRGARAIRNNVGALKDKRGKVVKFGLGKGSSDLIGIRPIVIRPEMVGQTIGQMVALEIKRPGKKPTKEQEIFIAAIHSLGGLAGWTDSVEGAREFLSRV